MLKKIILLGGCLYFSGGAWAQETKIIGFEQFFNNTQVTDFPAIAVDRSCNSTRGRIFVVYPEKENGNGKAIIRVRYSDNQGSTSHLVRPTIT